MAKELGYIHSIVTGGTLDGPGVRYVIFFQMCPLRCKYCHNPDTWAKNPLGAKTIDVAFNDILKYKSFFNFSGGGVTASGGEPLLQADFILELFKKLKQNNIHCAIDTCGYVDITPAIKELFSYTDLFMLDIKHLNPQIHKDLTGKENDKVIEFISYLQERNKKTRIRQVLLPGYTTDDKYIEDLIKFLAPYRNIIEMIELLPYHKMGVEKWNKLGLKYQINAESPDKKTLTAIKSKIEQAGFDTLLS